MKTTAPPFCSATTPGCGTCLPAGECRWRRRQRRPPPSLAQLLAHFQGLSERWGYSVEPPEALVDLLGYVALKQKALGEALDLFRYNVAAHPESAVAQESLGQALARAGQLDAARECYRQAVELAEKSGDPQLAPLRARLDALDERLQTPPPSGP